jgi:hypothetical protein
MNMPRTKLTALLGIQHPIIEAGRGAKVGFALPRAIKREIRRARGRGEGEWPLELGRAAKEKNEYDQCPQGQAQQEAVKHSFLGVGKLHVPIRVSSQIRARI